MKNGFHWLLPDPVLSLAVAGHGPWDKRRALSKWQMATLSVVTGSSQQ